MMLEVDVESNRIMFTEPLVQVLVGESSSDADLFLSPTDRRDINVNRRHNHFFLAHLVAGILVLLTLAVFVVFFTYLHPVHYYDPDDGNATNSTTTTSTTNSTTNNIINSAAIDVDFTRHALNGTAPMTPSTIIIDSLFFEEDGV